MNDANEFNQLVRTLFTKLFMCESSKVSLSILRRAPKVEDLPVAPVKQMGTYRDVTGVTRIEHNPNEQALIDLVYGISRESVGEEYFNQCEVNAYEFSNLTIAQIAEITYNEGTISLVTPTDAIEIYNLIKQYLFQVSNAINFSPHFKAPPDEDMMMFKQLCDLIEMVAIKFNPSGSGNGAYDQLLGLTNRSAVNSLVNYRDKLVLSKLDHTVKQGPSYMANPYQFKNNDTF